MKTTRLRRVVMAVHIVLATAVSAGAQTIGSLTAGQNVKVEGRARDGAMRVERVRLRDGDGQVRIESQIACMAEDGRILEVLGFIVTIPESTRILDGDTRLPGPAALRVGDRVEVRGTMTADNAITANRVRRSPVIGSPRDEMEAPIDRVVDTTTFTLLGRPMRFARGTKTIDERQGAARGRGLRRDDDEQQIEALRLGSWGTIGGRLEGDFEQNTNADLDTERDGHSSVGSGLRIEAVANAGPRIQGYAKVDVARDYALQPLRPMPGDVQVKEANVKVQATRLFTLEAGRVRVRDQFEWYADDYVDGVRALLDGTKTHAEIGISEGIRPPATGRSRTDERQLFASFTHEFSRAFAIASHLLARDDGARHEQPRWLFVQAYGRRSRVRYWSNAAVRRGRSQTGTLGGWAVDSGMGLRTFSGGPTLTLGYAMGSGDRDRSDSHDAAFRQTGMEDTETRLAGFKRLHTYGQLLQPDLSNLRVSTAGLGWQWSTVSFDAVHHAYWQDVPRRSASSSSLGLRPTGRGGSLGQEVDLLLTLRLRTGIDVSMAGGFYVAGPGQAPPRGSAYFWRPQLQIFF
jgi:alginate production protein